LLLFFCAKIPNSVTKIQNIFRNLPYNMRNFLNPAFICAIKTQQLCWVVFVIYIKKILYVHCAITLYFSTPVAFSAQLECILDAFLSPPKRFGLTEILHGTSALGGDRCNNRFSKRRELSQFNITNYSKLPVLLVTHF
jgi:hypothetical protein